MTADTPALAPDAGAARPLVPERIRPVARTLFYAFRGTRARALARVALRRAGTVAAPVFIIGCGRSGTTLLGELFSAHPAVRYLYEPYHLWAAIEPSADFVRLYTRGEQHCMLAAGAVTAAASARFRRLMSVPEGVTLVEKSPVNALRIGYLNALAPDARFVHIVRDGGDVVRSIERMAGVTRRMAFRQPLNEWWGVGDAKWSALRRDGHAAGYYRDEVGGLVTDAERGAYEWLVSVREAESWQGRLGARLVQLRYPDLTCRPREELRAVTGALGLPCPDGWLNEAAARVRPAAATDGAPLALPRQMCADFNSYQQALGFTGRAAQR